MSRIIGIRHRVKATTEGEARPTQIFIWEKGSENVRLDLKTEGDELDFIRSDLQEGDLIGMVLGGSGDSLAYGLANVGEKFGAKVFRIPAHRLKAERGEGDKENDAELLSALLHNSPQMFYEVRARDRALIEVSECYRARMEAQRARIACEQQLRSSFIGKMLRRPDGPYPEGQIEDLFNAEKASSVILSNFEKFEAQKDRELTKALEALDVYTEIFGKVEGCGMSVSARIIAAVGDVRRFETMPKFKAFLGVHVLSDGTFPRRRRNQLSNWNPSGRQGLYLFSEQMNRRPSSVWGLKLRENKAKLRTKHPVVVVEGGKKRYTDGHIHKMALWRTMTKFAEWLYREWWKLEGGHSAMRQDIAA
ncbi:transposase [Candidatus Parcubacteria bacterium]|nr:transposase [Candidatus Parcubacteria bacterium]